MLSSADLKRVIAEGSLVIEPFNEKSVRPSGITLHLGDTILKPLPGAVVDVKNGVTPDYEEHTISPDTPYRLDPGEFILGHTFESVTVGSNIGFLIEGRSTLARVGLTIVQTAMIVYPGHRNRCVTLELANHGVNTVLLYPKMKIARAAVFELRTPSDIDYDATGKYREQSSVGRPIFKNEFLSES